MKTSPARIAATHADQPAPAGAYYIGQPVVTNRLFGATCWADRATVVRVAETHVEIEYVDPPLVEGDFMRVNRTWPNVRPAT